MNSILFHSWCYTLNEPAKLYSKRRGTLEKLSLCMMHRIHVHKYALPFVVSSLKRMCTLKYTPRNLNVKGELLMAHVLKLSVVS